MVQSPAIIEYLEELYPQAPLLPQDLAPRPCALCGGGDRLRYASIAQRQRAQPAAPAGHDEPQVVEWIGHWISQGLAAVEQLIAGDHGFCFRRHGRAWLMSTLMPQVVCRRSGSTSSL